MIFAQIDIAALSNWFSENKINDSVDKIARLQIYFELIDSWSTRVNLVSRADIPLLVKNHFLDSLAPIEMIPHSSSLIDVGSGAGLPGIPLAIARADISVTLLESVHKKVLFLRQAILKLALQNVSVIEGRLEEMDRSKNYDIATVRALPKIERQIERIHNLVKPGGKIIYYEKRGVYKAIHI